MRTRFGLTVVVGSLPIACLAHTPYFGDGFVIDDFSPMVSDIVITGEAGLVADIDVELLGASHTWTGDLSAWVVHVESGLRVDLFDRVEIVNGVGQGSPSDLGGDYRFTDEARQESLWWGVDSSPVESGRYGPTSTNNAPSSLGAFDGLPVSGTWRLFITDLAESDTGSLEGWAVHIRIPSAGAAALALVGGLAGLRRRRASHQSASE